MSGYDPSGYSLISAIRLGEIERVREIINSVGLSNPPSWPYWYILLRDTIKKNKVEIAKLLLSKDIIVSYKCPKQQWSFSPLHFAIENGNEELVKLLLEKGVNIITENRFGDTPLHTAVKHGKSKISEMLLEKKAPINVRNNSYLTPLHIASKEGHLNIVEQLLNKGADVNIIGMNDETPIHLAIDNGHTAIVKQLLNHSADVNAVYTYITDPDLEIFTSGFTPLHLACEQGNEDVVKMLLNKGAKINVKDGDHSLPIFYATQSGHINLIKAILEHQIFTDYASSVDNMLREAVKNGDLITVHYTLKHYTEFSKLVNPKTNYFNFLNNNPSDLVDELGQSLLHLSAQFGNFEIMEAILDFGADIDIKDKVGRTPLHIACQERFGPVIGILLRYGPDLNVRCDEGYLPQDYLFSSKLYSQRFNRHINYDNDPDCLVGNPKDLIKLFVEHIIKLKTAKIFVSDINLQLVKNNSRFKKIENEFNIESEKLKVKKISKNLYFYDILYKNIDELTPYTKNKTVIKVLESRKYTILFPHYGFIIKSKFKKSRQRKLLLDESIKSVSNIFSKLPILCIEKILMDLSNYDLKILIDN